MEELQLESIEALDKFIVKHQKDYVERHRTTERENDNIEHEVRCWGFHKSVQGADLQRRIKDEDKNGTSRPWLGIMVDNSQADIVAHRHGLILNERLHAVITQFHQLRAIRFQESVDRATPRRKPEKVSISHSTDASRYVSQKSKKAPSCVN
ncbi:syntaxin-81-like [Papaver somniferum]|uniref:syntaxin-81-like n=1 Tax=Papaver somniferum TaxID=3469 RepID=UPI000E6F6F4C|nr:syntaxin-81-like [Papaver somniferum]